MYVTDLFNRVGSLIRHFNLLAMSSLDQYNSMAAEFASKSIEGTNNLLASQFNYDNTIKLAKYQKELDRQDAEFNRNMKLKSYQDAVTAAHNAGVNPLTALGHDPIASAATMGSNSITPYSGLRPTSAPDLSGSLLLGKQLEKMDAEIDNAKTDNAIKQSTLDTNAGVNQAINDKLKSSGFEVPLNQSEGFLRGMNNFDQYLLDSDDRALKRLANDNQRFIEKLKQDPEAQKKMREGFYAELEKTLVSLEDQKELLKGRKLDNTKKWQDIEIGEQHYRLVKAQVFAQMYDNEVIKPLETAKLESEVSASQSNAEYLMFKLDTEKWRFVNQQQKSNPWYWYDKRDEEFSNGQYWEASKSWLLGGLYIIPDAVGSGIGKMIK